MAHLRCLLVSVPRGGRIPAPGYKSKLRSQTSEYPNSCNEKGLDAFLVRKGKFGPVGKQQHLISFMEEKRTWSQEDKMTEGK